MNQKTLTNFFAVVILLAPLLQVSLVYADELININTADSTALQTLNGIGPSKAQAVIDYRTQNGAFTNIEDIMNVSGIGTATFNNIKNFITVGSTSQAQTQTSTATSSAQTQTQTETPTQSQSQASGMGPPQIIVRITTDARVMAGGGSYFSANAYSTQNISLPDARFVWNFGDGGVAEGAKVFHVYAYPGRYAVSVSGAYNFSSGIDRVVVEAVSAIVSLEAAGDGSLLIRNNSAKEINIGLWSLVDGEKSYMVPEGTIVLAHEGVRFAAAITGLQGTPQATLRYPNSTVAASAIVAAESPLRGERVTAQELVAAPASVVSAPPAQKSAPPVPEEGEVLGVDTSASLPQTETGGSSSLGYSLAALAVLLGGGVAGVRYMQRLQKETSLRVDGFDIEE